MNLSQQRAWLALDIGPIWRRRRPAQRVHSAATAAPPVEEAAPVETVRGRAVAAVTADDFFLLPDTTGRWLFVGAATPADAGAEHAADPMRLLMQMLAATGLCPGELHHVRGDRCRGDVEPARIGAQPDTAHRAAGSKASGFPAEAALASRIETLRPQLIIALGEAAARLLLQVDTPFASLRMQSHAWRPHDAAIPLLVTWHPAALLELPQRKAQAWEDLCCARELSARLAGSTAADGAGRSAADQ